MYSSVLPSLNDIFVQYAGDGAAARGPVYEAMTFASMDQYRELWPDEYKGGLPIIGGSLKPEEKTEIFAWVDRVIANLK